MRRKTRRASRKRTYKRKRNTFKRKSIIKKSKKLSGGRGSDIGKGGFIKYYKCINNLSVINRKISGDMLICLEIIAQWGNVNQINNDVFIQNDGERYNVTSSSSSISPLSLEPGETFYYLKIYVHNKKSNNLLHNSILKLFQWTDSFLKDIRGRSFFSNPKNNDSSRKSIWNKIIKIMDYYIDPKTDNMKSTLVNLIRNDNQITGKFTILK